MMINSLMCIIVKWTQQICRYKKKATIPSTRAKSCLTCTQGLNNCPPQKQKLLKLINLNPPIMFLLGSSPNNMNLEPPRPGRHASLGSQTQLEPPTPTVFSSILNFYLVVFASFKSQYYVCTYSLSLSLSPMHNVSLIYSRCFKS